MNVGPQPCTTTPTTDLNHSQMKVNHYIRAPKADSDIIEVSFTSTTFTTTFTTTTGVFTSSLTTTIDGKATVVPITMTGTRTLTMEIPIHTSINTTSATTGALTSSPTTTIDGKATIIRPTMTGTRTVITEAPITTSTNTSTQSGDPIVTSGHNQTSRAIVGGVLGAAGFIILALVIFFVLRHKGRYKASRSTSTGDDSTSSNVPGQCMSQSAHLSPTLRPFLDFPVMQNYPPTKGVTIDRAGIIPAQNSLGGIEPENPFVDPVVTESNNEGEGQRVRKALDNLQELTSRFEGELQQLCALAQSGQLSAEDSLKLEEIRRSTGLTIQFDSRRDRFSVITGSASAGSSFSLDPPSYHTRGG